MILNRIKSLDPTPQPVLISAQRNEPDGEMAMKINPLTFLVVASMGLTLRFTNDFHPFFDVLFIIGVAMFAAFNSDEKS